MMNPEATGLTQHPQSRPALAPGGLGKSWENLGPDLRLIDIGGVALELLHIAAAPSAPPKAALVFLHEGLGSVSLWRDWPAQLCAATGRAGWVYSRQGYGQSDPVLNVRADPSERDGRRTGRLLPDYLHRQAWQVLPALLHQLGITAPVLIGHSDGASIALLHASRHPVAACVALAPHVMVEALSIQSIAQARDDYRHGPLRQRLARHHADVDCAFWQWNDVWLSEGFRSFDIRPDCRQISAPLLAIQGENDPYGTLAQVRDLATAAPHTQLLELANCGHSPQRDQTERVSGAIAEFLRGV